MSTAFVPGGGTDRAHAWETVVGVDPTAEVHFGNLPHEGHHAGGEVYENNALSTLGGQSGRTRARRLGLQRDDVRHSLARPRNAYETSKLAGEAVAERVANAFDVPVASIRPSWILYPGRYQVMSFGESFSLSEADASGNLRSYVDIRDVVSIVEAIASSSFV